MARILHNIGSIGSAYVATNRRGELITHVGASVTTSITLTRTAAADQSLPATYLVSATSNSDAIAIPQGYSVRGTITSQTISIDTTPNSENGV